MTKIDRLRSKKICTSTRSGRCGVAKRAKVRAKFKKHPLSIAWEKWINSSEGRDCMMPGAVGVYLENRLLRAFMAGAFVEKLPPRKGARE